LEERLNLAELRDSARRVLLHVRGRAGDSHALWSAISDLGWLGIAVPPSLGGMDQPMSALAVLYQELGRVLAPHQFLSSSTCMAALSPLCGGMDPLAALIQQCVAGKSRLVDGTCGAQSVIVARGRLNGTVRALPDAAEASHLLVCTGDCAPHLIVMPLPSGGISMVQRPAWDRSRRLFDIGLDDVDLGDAALIIEGRECVSAVSRIAAHRDFALACDSLGGADAIFSETLSYMQSRQQFGRPIGSFQSLKHRCADLAMAMAGAQAQVAATGLMIDAQHRDWQVASGLCRLYAGAVYRSVSEEAVQFHGAIGFTWEHSCHRYLKRARLNDVLGGTPEVRKDALAPVVFRTVRRERALAN
jgi:alkylation response protein AidB-like acyl-CoA dehydrogenase